jgi:hypothetical protein
VPFLTMAYDGLEQSNTLTRLEAFMFQAHQYNVTSTAKAQAVKSTH